MRNYRFSFITGDCWFLSALSVLTQREKDFLKVFEDHTGDSGKELERMGIYSLNFYKNGKRVNVIIDSFFPAWKQNKSAAFAHSKEKNETWVMVIEKAYSKLHKVRGRTHVHGREHHIHTVTVCSLILSFFPFSLCCCLCAYAELYFLLPTATELRSD